MRDANSEASAVFLPPSEVRPRAGVFSEHTFRGGGGGFRQADVTRGELFSAEKTDDGNHRQCAGRDRKVPATRNPAFTNPPR